MFHTEILFYERMAFLLDLWTSLILGILYLTFEAFPIIFGEEHHFNVQSTGLSFIGIGVGMLIGLFTQLFYFNRYDAFIYPRESHFLQLFFAIGNSENLWFKTRESRLQKHGCLSECSVQFWHPLVCIG